MIELKPVLFRPLRIYRRCNADGVIRLLLPVSLGALPWVCTLSGAAGLRCAMTAFPSQEPSGGYL